MAQIARVGCGLVGRPSAWHLVLPGIVHEDAPSALGTMSGQAVG